MNAHWICHHICPGEDGSLGNGASAVRGCLFMRWLTRADCKPSYTLLVARLQVAASVGSGSEGAFTVPHRLTGSRGPALVDSEEGQGETGVAGAEGPATLGLDHLSHFLVAV